MKSRKWTLKSYFVGPPKREDMELVEEELPALQEGGKLGTVEYIGYRGANYLARCPLEKVVLYQI